ncbi:hypothetical protein SAMN06297468_1822 [Altererythrobacter xiamenensis]|uniref:Uncharacterized protein n=1 Tax=Altererythrobacter xiamenensis TaxID=1316679 RepID=A0A1Y6F439_9SPHN|nr:hypothetical protein [Altererythrobacter xiamenensis]SMQ69635.1 hypothetical protein SAMN06297468_1822 [Altererythrobacter xiamenensis]
MADSYEFYCERADAAKAAAEGANLDNVRERELRAEKTWRGLAEQARKVKQAQERSRQEKEEAREQRNKSE